MSGDEMSSDDVSGTNCPITVQRIYFLCSIVVSSGEQAKTVETLFISDIQPKLSPAIDYYIIQMGKQLTNE